MNGAGLSVVRYQPSTKGDHSLLTKLISKPRVTAAQIFDKLRFRLVMAQRDQLIPAMRYLARHLFPLNHIIPGESHNTILSETEVAAQLDGQVQCGIEPWHGAEVEAIESVNPATAKNFRMIGFVVDLPVRVDALISPEQRLPYTALGHLLYVTLEIQLFDEASYDQNQHGDANHEAYKQRQLASVAKRLWGADVPPIKCLK